MMMMSWWFTMLICCFTMRPLTWQSGAAGSMILPTSLPFSGSAPTYSRIRRSSVATHTFEWNDETTGSDFPIRSNSLLFPPIYGRERYPLYGKVLLPEHSRHSHVPLMGFPGSFMGSSRGHITNSGWLVKIIYHVLDKEGSNILSQLLHNTDRKQGK